MRRAALAVTLAVSLACGAIFASAGSAAVPRSFYGIVQFAPLTSSDFVRMGGARVGTLRAGISWSELQTTRNGPFNFSSIDATVRGAAQQGISILGTLAFEPAFVTGPCSTQGCARHIYISNASDRSGWINYVSAVVHRYGPGGGFWQQNPGVPYHPVRKWQIWNEQNAPTQHNSAGLYAKLLKISDNTISGIDRGAQIMVGGMFGTPKGSKKFTAWHYLKGIYNHGGKRHFDAIALHPYSPDIPGTLDDQIKKMRGVLKAHNDGKTPLYVTEIGWGSSRTTHGGTGSLGAQFNVGPKKQAKDLKDAFKLLTSHRKTWKIGGVDWFTWKDPSNPPPGLCAFCYSAGLYHADGVRAKPALKAYKSFTRNTSGGGSAYGATAPRG